MSTLYVNTIKPQSGTVVAVSGTLEISGAINSYEFNTITTSVHSGSNAFGNDLTDLHQFTGSLHVTGAMLVSGSSGLTIHGAEAGSANINLKADQADDAADTTVISVADGGVFTVDCASDIVLDADGAEITFKDAGTQYAKFSSASGHEFTGSLNVSGSGIVITAAEAGTATITLNADQGDDGADTTTLSVADGGDFTIASGADIILNPSGGDVLPNADNTRNLGSATKRWANLYTGDLHLKNDRGDWTILEEQDYLCVINNATGKKYKMMLQEIDD